MKEITKQILESSLGISHFEFSNSSSRDDIAAWDSLRHMELILAIEKELGTQLSVEKIISLDSVAAVEKLFSDATNAR